MKNVDKSIQDARKILSDARVELIQELQRNRGRERGEIVRKMHLISEMLGEGGLFFSQAGQDRIVDKMLGAKDHGTFVDVGGYDGVTGSNTLFFEMFRRWRGLLIEPAPSQLKTARELRRCPCQGYAVSGGEGTAEFIEVTGGYTQMSGFLESYDQKILEKVRANPKHEEVLHQLEKKPLNEILDEQNLTQIDYLSLDVEGGEMDILESFDFERFDVDIWSIENNQQSSDLPKFMDGKGYKLVEFCGVDDIFRKAPKAE